MKCNMKEIKWYDIEQVQPEKGQAIFYIDVRTYDDYTRCYSGTLIPCVDDIDRGMYIKDNLVEWYYDMAPEEFRLWFPIPTIELDTTITLA